MFIGLSMILVPVAVYIVSLPLSRRLKPGIRKVYRIAGGLVVILGGGVSYYLASYTGDQGGIAAYFFQITVILVYLALSLLLVILNWLANIKDSRESAN